MSNHSIGLAGRAELFWRDRTRDFWPEFLAEVFQVAFIWERRSRKTNEPRIWLCNGFNGFGADGGLGGRIGRYDVVCDWRLPPRWQWLPFVKRDGWQPEWWPPLDATSSKSDTAEAA